MFEVFSNPRRALTSSLFLSPHFFLENYLASSLASTLMNLSMSCLLLFITTSSVLEGALRLELLFILYWKWSQFLGRDLELFVLEPASLLESNLWAMILEVRIGVITFPSLCDILSSGAECWMCVREAPPGSSACLSWFWNAHPMRWIMDDRDLVSSAESCLRQNSRLTSGDWMEESTLSLLATLSQNIDSVIGNCEQVILSLLGRSPSAWEPREEEYNPVFLAFPVRAELISC